MELPSNEGEIKRGEGALPLVMCKCNFRLHQLAAAASEATHVIVIVVIRIVVNVIVSIIIGGVVIYIVICVVVRVVIAVAGLIIVAGWITYRANFSSRTIICHLPRFPIAIGTIA